MARTSRPVTRQGLIDDGLEWLLDTTFLCHLEPTERDATLQEMEWVGRDRDVEIIRQGAPPPGVFLIVSGEATVTQAAGSEQPSHVTRLGPGQLVGEHSAFTGEPTNASVRTVSPIVALYLSANKFQALATESENLRTYVTELDELRGRWVELMSLLARHPFLRSLGRNDLERLVQSAQIQRYSPGEVLVQARALSRDIFVVIRGRVSVFAPSDSGPREELATKGPGFLFGHAAALLDLPRTADVEAREPTEVLRFEAPALMGIIDRNPTVARRFYQELAGLDLHVERAKAAHSRTQLVAIYGCGRQLGTTSLAYGIAGALSDRFEVLVVDLDGDASMRLLGVDTFEGSIGEVDILEARVPESWGIRVLWPASPDQVPELVARLQDGLGDNAYILLASAASDARNISAMRLAPSVIFVRSALDGTHKEAAQHSQYRVDAVRLVSGGVMPIETSGRVVRVPDGADPIHRFWAGQDLGALTCERTAFGRACHRLVRALRGQLVGLALGGGGALGYAHIGLIRMLHEASIPIDFVAGVSFGALVGGFYAIGGLDALTELIERRRWVAAAGLGSSISTQLVAQLVYQFAGRVELGMTEIPFYPVAVDVTHGREVVCAHGPVGEGVRTSCGLPGIYPAARRVASRLVDGGINNNVPASVVWNAGAHFILASNIIPRFPFDDKPIFAFRGHAIPLLARIDEVVRSLYLLMSQTGRDRSQLADYVFNLRIQGINIHEFWRGDAIAQAGRTQADEQLEDILFAYREATNAS